MKPIYSIYATLIIMSLFVAGCMETEKTTELKEGPTVEKDPVQTPLPIDEIESLARTKIPKSAFDIQTHTKIWMDTSIYIIFQLPANDLDDFLIKAGFTDLEPGYWPFSDTPVPWWPKQSEFVGNSEKIFAGTELSLADERFGKHIGVDMTQEDIYTIYLLCFDV